MHAHPLSAYPIPLQHSLKLLVGTVSNLVSIWYTLKGQMASWFQHNNEFEIQHTALAKATFLQQVHLRGFRRRGGHGNCHEGGENSGEELHVDRYGEWYCLIEVIDWSIDWKLMTEEKLEIASDFILFWFHVQRRSQVEHSPRHLRLCCRNSRAGYEMNRGGADNLYLYLFIL